MDTSKSSAVSFLSAIKFLAVGTAIWSVPGLMPYYGVFQDANGFRSLLGFIATIMAIVMMLMAAKEASNGLRDLE